MIVVESNDENLRGERMWPLLCSRTVVARQFRIWKLPLAFIWAHNDSKFEVQRNTSWEQWVSEANHETVQRM